MPESYIPSRDLYIEKEIDINDEIDKLRHSATCSLFERRDTIVVASVSCIYGLGAPGEYYKMSLSLRPGDNVSREAVIKNSFPYSTSATTWTFTVAHSVCVATFWKYSPPPTRTRYPCGILGDEIEK